VGGEAHKKLSRVYSDKESTKMTRYASGHRSTCCLRVRELRRNLAFGSVVSHMILSVNEERSLLSPTIKSSLGREQRYHHDQLHSRIHAEPMVRQRIAKQVCTWLGGKSPGRATPETVHINSAPALSPCPSTCFDTRI
jgi:hypothetical protein